MSHGDFFHPQIAHNIEQSENDGGIWLKDIEGDAYQSSVPVKVQTQNTLYTITDVDAKTHKVDRPK